MSETQQTVTRKDVDGVDESGQMAHQTTRKISTHSSGEAQSTIVNVIWFIYGVIAILLGLRFIFLATGANASSGFVSFIYSFSHIFSAPFDSIFSAKTVAAASTKSVIEPSVIVAIVIYALIAWGIVKLVTINANKDKVQ